MAAPVTINDILSQVKQLGKQDQLTLLQRLNSLLTTKDAESTAPTRLTALSGLGSRVWNSKEDIDNYIDEERKW